MISWDLFKEKMHEVCLLTGQNPSLEQMKAIHRKIKDFDPEDFIKACDDEELLEELSYRMNYPSIKRAILKYQQRRQEAEYVTLKKKEEEELKKLISSEWLGQEIRQFIKSFGK